MFELCLRLTDECCDAKMELNVPSLASIFALHINITLILVDETAKWSKRKPATAHTDAAMKHRDDNCMRGDNNNSK